MRSLFLLACVLACAPMARAAEPAWPRSGVGVNGPVLVKQFQERGFTPRQTWRYIQLLDAFASPGAIDPQIIGTPAGSAWATCRSFGEGLRSRQTQSPAALGAWEQVARQRLVDQAIQAQRTTGLSSFVAGCGMDQEALQAYLVQDRIPGEEVDWKWADLSSAWEKSEKMPSVDVEHLRARLGLRWLRISAWQLQSPRQWAEVRGALLQEDRKLREMTGWALPVLSLDGRIGIDLSQQARPGLSGQAVYSPEGLVLRGKVDELSHEWLHALDHALSPHPGEMSSTQSDSPLARLLVRLRTSDSRFEDEAHKEEIARTLSYVRQDISHASIDPWAFHASSARELVEALRRAGMPWRDALFLGATTWRLRQSSSESWVARREAVAQIMSQGQSQGWIPKSAEWEGSPAYVSNPSELLASDFAGVMQSCSQSRSAFPLQMPGCVEAKEHRKAWVHFFQANPLPEQKRQALPALH